MKNFILNTASLWLVAAITAITAMSFTACAKKSERTEGSTQVQTHHAYEHEGGPGDDYEALPPDFVNPYAAILDGDLSDFAGTWVDGFGTRSQLRADGVFTSGSMGDLMADGFSMYDYGAYYWNVRSTDGYGGFGVMVYPPGVPINLFYMDGGVRKIAGTIETDTTKVRIITGHDGPSSSAEVYYREGEAPAAAPSNPRLEILNGDLSAFAGTWVNNEGGTYTIPQPQSWENEFPGGFKQFENYYTWWHPSGDFGINLFPVGVDFFVPTDTTKTRLITENLHTPPVVYYRKGETPTQSGNTAADGLQQTLLGGRVWHFQSGDSINFFKHYRELILIDFRIDGNVYVTDQNIDRSSFTVSGRWHITSGQLEIRPDTEGLSAMRSVLSFSYKISGNLLTIIDDEGYTATYYEIFPYG